MPRRNKACKHPGDVPLLGRKTREGVTVMAWVSLSSTLPPPQPIPSLLSEQGLQAPGERAELGIFKALSVRPEQEREPRLPSGPNAPQVTLEQGCVRKLPAGRSPSQPSPARGSSAATLPLPKDQSEIQLGKQRKWKQREGKSFPVKRKEGG